MDMPSYDQYEKMFGAGPFSTSLAMDQMDLAKQFQQGRQRRQDLDNRGVELANLFAEQTNPLKVEQQRATTSSAQSDSRVKKLDADIAEQTFAARLNAEQKKQVLAASKADLDALEIGAQRLAYSTNPQERAQGEAFLRMHREFIKMRDQAAIDADKAKTKHGYDVALENQRHRNATDRAKVIAGAKARAQSDTVKMTTDQQRAHYIRLGQEAMARGENDVANEMFAMAQYITNLRAYERPNSQEGKPDLGAVAGIPTVPAKQPPTPPQGPVSGALYPNGTPRELPKPTHSMADLQKMYPGRSPEELRERYKKIYGVEPK